jgi:acetyltransferase-like isoleucine patch superfamily enzyme
MKTQDAALSTSPAATVASAANDPKLPTPASVAKLAARSWLGRAKRVALEEVENLHFRLLLANLIVGLLPNVTFSRLRTAIYRLAGVQIGPHSLILGRIGFTGFGPIGRRLSIGSNTIINGDCFADLNAEVHIGNWVSIGHHVTFITAAHDLGPAACRAGRLRPDAIVVGDGSWIGARSTILPGVTIGASSVVAAGSVVSGSVPPNRVVGGNPARPLKSLPPEP